MGHWGWRVRLGIEFGEIGVGLEVGAGTYGEGQGCELGVRTMMCLLLRRRFGTIGSSE